MINEKLHSLSKIYSISAIDDMIHELLDDYESNTRSKELLNQLSNFQIKEIHETYFKTITLLLENILNPFVDYYEIYYKKAERIDDFLYLYSESSPAFVMRIINDNKSRIFFLSNNLENIIDTENNISAFLNNMVFDKIDDFNSWQNKPDPIFEKYYNKNFYSKVKRIENETRTELEKIFDITEDNHIIDDILNNKRTMHQSFKYQDYKNQKITKIIRQKELKLNKLFSNRFSDFDKSKKIFLENHETTLNDIFTLLKYTFDLDVSLLEFFIEKSND